MPTTARSSMFLEPGCNGLTLACTPLTAGTVATTLMQEDAPCGTLEPIYRRSLAGKILRAAMRRIADGQEYNVPPTIDDPTILDDIIQMLAGRS